MNWWRQRYRREDDGRAVETVGRLLSWVSGLHRRLQVASPWLLFVVPREAMRGRKGSLTGKYVEAYEVRRALMVERGQSPSFLKRAGVKDGRSGLGDHPMRVHLWPGRAKGIATQSIQSSPSNCSTMR